MEARYILRFDDICPTMNWKVWDQVEAILNRYNIKPIIAVVPDNKDPELMIDPAHDDFWEKVRGWQANGWTVALHGYQHLYTTKNAGLTKTNPYSEFVGLTFEEQYNKIKRGLEVFEEQGVRAEAWIAPAHSFDELTIKALLEFGINIISDGYYLRPVSRLGVVWVPQQLWRFRKMPWGLWTICYHHNEFFTQQDVDRFAADVNAFAPSIISFTQGLTEFTAKPYGLVDRMTESLWRFIFWLKALSQKH